MRPSRSRHVLMASAKVCTLAAVLTASSAMAQDKKVQDSVPTCNPNAVVTQALAKATFSLQRAFQNFQIAQATTKQGGAPTDSLLNLTTRDLKEAIHHLTTPPDKKENGDSIGRLYYLGQAYIVLLQQPGIKPIGKRSDYGIATDSNMTVDLLAAADTALTRVSTQAPLCASEMDKWRQQAPWLDALNGSINALNAQKFDSAEALAKRSLVINRMTPYPYSVLASVANHRKDYDTATEMIKKSIEIAGTDTLYADARVSAMYDLAATTTSRADESSGPEKKQRVQDAIAAWQQFIPVGTRDLQVASAVQTIARLLKSTGDSASAFTQAYAPIIANTSQYGETTLLNAGLIATRAKKSDDAVKLFAAVLEKNPYQRDALNNLAASYVSTNEHSKMFPLIDTLVSLDPNSSDNWTLYAYAYSGLLKNVTDPARNKMLTDSLMKYNNKAQNLQTRVSLSGFAHSPNETTLTGSIENRRSAGKGAKASSASMTYTMDVTFLDAKGQTVGQKSVQVGPVAPGGSEPFTVSIPSEAVAFRYKPLP